MDWHKRQHIEANVCWGEQVLVFCCRFFFLLLIIKRSSRMCPRVLQAQNKTLKRGEDVKSWHLRSGSLGSPDCNFRVGFGAGLFIWNVGIENFFFRGQGKTRSYATVFSMLARFQRCSLMALRRETLETSVNCQGHSSDKSEAGRNASFCF